jgi:hypothetical protein
MLKTIFRNFFLIVLLTLSVAPFASAKTAVGKVIISIGSSTAVQADGVARPLKRRSDVFEGDVLKTGDMARLQVRFIDGQLIALKADTEFKIEEYKYKQGNKDTASMTLFKGGMRAITGAIGKVDKADYKVKTPVASLGVRGTHYGLFYCPGNCGRDAQGNANKPGLYGGVVDGSIVLTNEAGSTQFDNDQYFTIASQADAPQMLFQPPSNVFGSDEPAPEEGSNAGEPLPAPDGEETTAAATEGEETAITGDGTSTTSTVFTTGDQATVVTTGGTLSAATAPPTLLTGAAAPGGAGLVVAGIPINSMGFDGGGESIIQGMGGESFNIATVGMAANQFVNGTFVGMTTDTLNVYSDATLSEVGGNGTLGVNWGRWSGGKIEIIEGGVTTTSFTPDGFAFVYSPNLTSPSTLTGFVSAPPGGMSTPTYNYAMGPSFRDETGAVLSGTASISVDFSAQSVTGVNLSLAGNGRSYSATSVAGSVSFSSLQVGTDIMLMGTCTGGTCSTGTSLSGNAGGQFVGPAAEGIIGYFGVKNTAGTVSAAGTGLFLR